MPTERRNATAHAPTGNAQQAVTRRRTTPSPSSLVILPNSLSRIVIITTTTTSISISISDSNHNRNASQLLRHPEQRQPSGRE
ncbi:hypothetical protein BFJ72_g11984 [Fusarium proliferatum]|uniref:Uncharacterized protein n=1 Tax=Gibberella intermedia TaxID=948311 RepID=A0A420SJT2_GIBIN|nr:hypothetical protein BFJ72_g11984 [Fusarium proliferatum]